MKTLVTGAAGFIGSHVVRELLAEGADVRAFVLPGEDVRNLEGLDIEKVEGNILDAESIRKALEGCDTLYHLAAIYKLWMPDDQLIYDVNVRGSTIVLEEARRAGISRVVYTSSIAAVGIEPGGTPATEETVWNLGGVANAYIISKRQGELEAKRFAENGLPVVIVNPSFPFGAGDVGPTPTGEIMLNTLKGKVPFYIDGGINVVDVVDVAKGHVLAAKNGKVGERYILGNHNLEHHEFLALVAKLGGVKAPTRRIPTPIVLGASYIDKFVADWITKKPPMSTPAAIRVGTLRWWFDCTKAREDLGLSQTPIEESVQRAIDWFREQGYVGSKS